MNARVSIVLATYNGEKFLTDLLQSLELQSYRPAEIIISDDGSTDSTIEICRQFALSSPFEVHLIETEGRLGYGENFLRSCTHASGELIAFCDQDDIWATNKLERCVEAFENSDVMLCAHTANLINHSAEVIGRFSQGIKKNSLMLPGTNYPWGVYFGFSMMFRRELIDWFDFSQRGQDYNDPSQLMAHDRYIYFLANAIGQTAVLAEPLVSYRQHGGNVFGFNSRQKTVKEKCRSKIAAERNHLYFKLATHRKSFLSLHAEQKELEQFSEELKKSALQWELVAQSVLLRGEIYRSGFIVKRFRAFAECVFSGVYFDPRYKQNALRSLLKDLLITVIG